MKRLLSLLAIVMLWGTTASAALKPDTEYYLWLNIYEKLIGTNAEGTSPALSEYGVNDDAASYIFIAESSGKDGYVLLRQKSSNKYLAASGSNSYSIVFEAERSTADRYCWKVDEGTYTYLSNKKNSKYVGVDGAQKGKDYVPIYYDKPKGSHSQFSAIPAVGENWDEARQAFESEVYTNAQGVQEIDYCQVKDRVIDRSDAVDIHITSNMKPIQGNSTINLGGDHTWLIIDNFTPSEVISNYLRFVTINGKKATNGTNCRVAIYLNGAAIIPTTGKKVLSFDGTAGESTLNVTDGFSAMTTKYNNTMTSFVLQRGYMATLATGTEGSGYSRVFVADHADLAVTLPEALAKRVTSVNIKPWQYLSKKGWGDTAGNSKGSDLKASWFWSWSAGYSSSQDIEFVPCRQHKSWPSASEVNSKTSSAAFSINEPEHSEQHTSDKCSCGGTVDAWYCTTITPDFQAGGGRIGSPQPTDFSWMYDYFSKADGMAYRCDFAVTHSYWDISGRSEADYASYFVNRCKEVWSNTGRPLWITELEIGSSWGEKVTDYDKYRSYLVTLLQKMEESDWIERYAIYEYDVYGSYMYYRDDKTWNRTGLTPAGQVYRDHRSTFAYHSNYTKTPVWWAPSAKKPSLGIAQNEKTGKFTFTITNPNTDMTDELYVEHLTTEGTWEEVARVTSRNQFERDNIQVTGVIVEGAYANTDIFRAVVKTLRGVIVTSDSGFVTNPNINATSKTNVDGWTLTRESYAGATKAESGDTYFEVWGSNAANINFNYYQDVTDLPAGVYRLMANVFNTLDGVSGAVNGAVGLYAQSADQFYFAPVTEDAQLDAEAKTLDGVPVAQIDRIIVQEGGQLRVGVRNLGVMQARWAGADNFVLLRTGDLNDVNLPAEQASAEVALYDLMPPSDGGFDASRFIVNPDANNKTSYGWKVSNVDFKSDNESFDGNASNSYWNIWKSGAFNSSMSQDITGLPAGTYTFSALLRGQETAELTLTAMTTTSTGSKTFTGVGATSSSEDEFPNGWRRITTEPITVQHGQTVTLSLTVKTTATAWWSADHFALTLTEKSDDAVGIQQTTRPTADPYAIYDLAGRRVAYPTLKRGIYIVGSKKVLLK